MACVRVGPDAHYQSRLRSQASRKQEEAIVSRSFTFSSLQMLTLPPSGYISGNVRLSRIEVIRKGESREVHKTSQRGPDHRQAASGRCGTGPGERLSKKPSGPWRSPCRRTAAGVLTTITGVRIVLSATKPRPRSRPTVFWGIPLRFIHQNIERPLTCNSLIRGGT